MFNKIKHLISALLIGCLIVSMSVTAFADSTEHPNSVSNSNSNSEQGIVFDGVFHQKDALSDTTIEWLNWYNELSAEQQEMVSYVPSDLLNAQTLRGAIEAIEAVYPDDNFSVKSSETGAPVYNPDWWNDSSRIKKANCYAYAMDVIQNFEGKLQPGQLAGSVYDSLTESSIYNAVVKDGPYLGNGRTIRRSNASESVGAKEYKVALVIAPNKDYHWYVLNSNGYWSHKRGQTEVTNVDASGKKITNPKTCDRNYGGGLNYSTFCNYYIITRG